MAEIAPSPVVDQCQGCAHIFESRCRIYYLPEAKWIAGACPLCTTRKKAEEQKDKFLDPIKASKRKAKGK